MQKSVQRGLTRDAVPGAGDADRDRQRDRPIPRRLKSLERGAWPRRARDVEEGAALRVVSRKRSFDGTKAAASSATARNAAASLAGNRAVRMNKKHRVAEAAAVAEHRREPCPAASRRP